MACSHNKEKGAVPFPKSLASDHLVGQKPFLLQISFHGYGCTGVTTILHSDVHLPTYFFLSISPQTKDFKNYANKTNLKLSLRFYKLCS